MPKHTKDLKLRRHARRAAASEPLPMSMMGSTIPVREQVQPAEGKKNPLEGVENKVSNNTTTTTTTTTSSDTNAKEQESKTPSASHPNLSRGQRKRMAKREQFLKKEQMILATLMLKKREEQKRRIDGLDAMKEALLETVQTSNQTGKKPNGTTTSDAAPASAAVTENDRPTPIVHNKAKKALAASELERMNLIRQHPAFQADPYAAIQEHLRNTFADQKEKMQQNSKIRQEKERVKQEEKKRLKKERLQELKGNNNNNNNNKKKPFHTSKSKKKYKPRRTS